MSYPGNSTLSQDIRERVLATFEHTLQLVDQDGSEEALLGCDFILRLDPLFEPARVLQGRLRQAAGALGSRADLAGLVAQLREVTGTASARHAASPGSSAAGRGELHARIAGHLERREFQALLDLAAREGSADPVLRRAAAQAQERLEAAPYAEGFVAAARRALAAGEALRAEQELAKVRSLDPTHPALAELAPPLRPGPAAARDALPEPRDLSARADSFADFNLALDLGEEAASPPEADFEPPVPDPTSAGPRMAPAQAPPRLEGSAAPARGAGARLGPSFPAAGLEDTDGRIEALLAEGQVAFERRDFQGAIDAWSRIFLIDIDHDEANRRIEMARKHKAEAERRLEEVLHEGIGRFEAGDLEAARRQLGRVLALSPDQPVAREYLRRIDAAQGGPEPATPPAGEGPAPAARRQAAAIEGEAAAPAAAETATVGRLAAPRPAPTHRPSPRRPGLRFGAIGGLVLALAAAGGGYLWRHRARMFPNSSVQGQLAPVAIPDPIARARALHERGDLAAARAALAEVPPGSPRHAQAQALLAAWEGAAAPVPGATAADLAARAAAMAGARAAQAEGRLLDAADLLAAARRVRPLDGQEAALLAVVEAGLSPLAREIERFRAGDWEYLIGDLKRRREAEPDNLDLRRLLLDSTYNLGVSELRRGFPSAAARRFEQGLALAPGDPELQRLRAFSAAYADRSQDLLYQIFVKYLPTR